MPTWTRRDIIRLGLSGLVLASTSKLGSTPRPKSATAPRYNVIIQMGGGIDSIYTTDPRVLADVAPGVDVPYKASDIVETPHYRLGPQLAPLAKWSNRIAILNGVQIHSVSHESGHRQMHRLRTRATSAMPAILDILGRYRDGQPLATVHLGCGVPPDHSADFFGLPEPVIAARADNSPNAKNIFDEIEQNQPEDLARLAAVYDRHAKQLRDGYSSPESRTTAESFEANAKLFRMLPRLEPMVHDTWSPLPARQNLARNFQRILWLLENDITSGIYYRMGFLEWDSHYSNAERQTEWNLHFATMFERFLGELATRTNDHGSLIGSTAIVAGSEMGRFPRINSDLGKDHMPEVPFLFVGEKFAGGKAFGSTGREMESRKISLRTGLADDAHGEIPQLDDVGTTLLAMAGIDPTIYGYRGNRLQFLVAS